MKILIELPSWLGDTVMATPAIENLVGYYDNPEITLLGSDISVEILKNHRFWMIQNRTYFEMARDSDAFT